MKTLRYLILVLLFVPVATFAVYKPSRVLVPELNGVTCFKDKLCVDDIDRLDEARRLLNDAIIGLEKKIEPINYTPKFIFCSQKTCFLSFGFEQAAGHTIGKAGTVIGPRGWKDHYVKHELIHHWQADKLGLLSMIVAPEWITEGMAYALSDDPRDQLSEPFQYHVEKFRHWYSQKNENNLSEALKAEIRETPLGKYLVR